jgi:hypothetical protein
VTHGAEVYYGMRVGIVPRTIHNNSGFGKLAIELLLVCNLLLGRLKMKNSLIIRIDILSVFL